MNNLDEFISFGIMGQPITGETETERSLLKIGIRMMEISFGNENTRSNEIIKILQERVNIKGV
jgi:hypothetical protein